MDPLKLRYVFILLVVLALACTKKESDQSSSLGEASSADTQEGVVRSARLKTTGAIAMDYQLPGDDSSTLSGSCTPDMWANFGIKYEHPDYTWASVTIMTSEPIKTGQTGEVGLDWMDVSLFDKEFNLQQFKGNAKLNITAHNGDPKERRLTGILKGTDLSGHDAAEGKTISAEFSFDLNYSCGVDMN